MMDEPIATIPRLSQHLDTYASGYNQALTDFDINSLITQIQSLNPDITPTTAEKLTASLIQSLNHFLDLSILNTYLTALDTPQTDTLPNPISEEYSPLNHLPNTFRTPLFKIGDLLRYIPENDSSPLDQGKIIGLYYCYAVHQGTWMWRYVLWLDEDSPSRDWLKATVVWESDVEVYHGT
ncbi:MAG: hypothetical protein AB4041_05570 [Microcystaceae cyanobacterium]